MPNFILCDIVTSAWFPDCAVLVSWTGTRHSLLLLYCVVLIVFLTCLKMVFLKKIFISVLCNFFKNGSYCPKLVAFFIKVLLLSNISSCLIAAKQMYEKMEHYQIWPKNYRIKVCVGRRFISSKVNIGCYNPLKPGVGSISAYNVLPGGISSLNEMI